MKRHEASFRLVPPELGASHATTKGARPRYQPNRGWDPEVSDSGWRRTSANLTQHRRRRPRLGRLTIRTFATVFLFAACSGTPSADVLHGQTTSTSEPTASLSLTTLSSAAHSSTLPPASSVCSLASTAQITRLLQAGDVAVEPSSTGCRWFAADANVNVSLAVNFYDTSAEASATFQSEQLFDPNQHPYTLGDRAYTSALPPRHAVAKVLVGKAIVTVVVNGPTPQANAIAAAQAIIEPASVRVRQGWRP